MSELYKITQEKKTKTWMEVCCVFHGPLTSWSRGKVFKKAVRSLEFRSPSLLRYRLCLGQERLPKLYELEYDREKNKYLKYVLLTSIQMNNRTIDEENWLKLLKLPAAETVELPPNIWLFGPWSPWPFLSKKEKEKNVVWEDIWEDFSQNFSSSWAAQISERPHINPWADEHVQLIKNFYENHIQ